MLKPGGQDPLRIDGQSSSMSKCRLRDGAEMRANTGVSASRPTSRVFRPAVCHESSWPCPAPFLWFDHHGR